MKNKTFLRPGFGRSVMLLPLLGVLLVSACDKSTNRQPGAAESAQDAEEAQEAAAEAPAPAPAPAPSRVEEAKAMMGGMTGALEKMAAAFEGVKDEASAKAAAEVIAATTAEMTELGGKARALKEEMSEEEKKEMETDPAGPEMEAKLKAIMERLQKAAMALPTDPAVQQAIMPATKSFGEAMRAMSGYEPSAAPEGE